MKKQNEKEEKMDISNKFLVFLLVVAILVTIVGTWYSIDKISRFASLTGYQVTEGNVSVNITQRAEINVTQPNCAFGSGYVTAPFAYAILYPGNSTGLCTGTDAQGNWTNSTAYNPNCMEIRNDGNQNVNVKVIGGTDAAGMIGGTSPEYKVWSADKEAGACSSGLVAFGSRLNINSTGNATICATLKPNNSTDEMYAGCYLKIPDDTYGPKSDTWTFTGTAA